MTRRALYLLLGTAAFLLACGCASVPRDVGVADVSQVVAERTGGALAWQPGQPIEPPDGDAPDGAPDAALNADLQGELTVDRAVELALAHNRDLLATLEGLGIARADLIAARTVRNPLFEGEYHFPNQRFTPYEFAITQTLVDLIQLPRKRALGEAEMTAARLRVTASVVGFASEVRGDFYTLQATQAVLAQQQVVTAAAEAAAQLSQRQHEAGNVTDLDLETEQARYEQAKLALARAELDELQARERLLADLGATRSVPLRLAVQSAPPAEPAEPEAPVEQVEAAQDARLDVQLARAEVEAARRAGPIARAAPFDELAAGVHWDREAGGERSRGPIGTVPIPLFDRGLAARARATAVLRQAEQRLHALTVNGRAEARAAHERVLEARARAAYLGDVVLPRRQRILYLTQLEYDAMLRGTFDLLRARQELAGAERERVLAIRDYWLARTDYEAATNGVIGFSVRAERSPWGERKGSE